MKNHNLARRVCAGLFLVYLGMMVYLLFLQDHGQIGTLEAVAMRARAQTIFLEMCERQTEKVEGEKPTRLFIELLRELLETKQARLCDARPRTVAGITTENDISTPNTIGYEDDEFLYLIPRTAYSAVTAFYARSGYTFPASPSALWKMFMDEVRKDDRRMYGGDRYDLGRPVVAPTIKKDDRQNNEITSNL